MSVIDLVQETFSAFNSNRARSLLTVLGVVIGISAVIAMTALIGGVKLALVGDLGLEQSRLVNIFCSYGRDMTIADANEMADALSDTFEIITPESSGSAEVVSSTEKATGMILGVKDDYSVANGLKLAHGRYFTESEVNTASLVIVLDENGVKKLFGASANGVGKSVRIGGVDYEVVGVLPSEGMSFDSESVTVHMPISTLSQRVTGTTGLTQIYGLAQEGIDVETAAQSARDWLIERFQIPESAQDESVSVFTMKSIIEQLETLMAAFQVLMTTVASISLLVGGIGIMNMMLTNVTERIREIGLRKALGARRRDITRQFLLESVCLTLAGGVIGIVFGFLGASALAGVAGAAFSLSEGTTITPTIGFDTVALVAGICILIGVVFGFYPAYRAAKLDPVESLHYQ